MMATSVPVPRPPLRFSSACPQRVQVRVASSACGTSATAPVANREGLSDDGLSQVLRELASVQRSFVQSLSDLEIRLSKQVDEVVSSETSKLSNELSVLRTLFDQERRDQACVMQVLVDKLDSSVKSTRRLEDSLDRQVRELWAELQRVATDNIAAACPRSLDGSLDDGGHFRAEDLTQLRDLCLELKTQLLCEQSARAEIHTSFVGSIEQLSHDVSDRFAKASVEALASRGDLWHSVQTLCAEERAQREAGLAILRADLECKNRDVAALSCITSSAAATDAGSTTSESVLTFGSFIGADLIISGDVQATKTTFATLVARLSAMDQNVSGLDGRLTEVVDQQSIVMALCERVMEHVATRDLRSDVLSARQGAVDATIRELEVRVRQELAASPSQPHGLEQFGTDRTQSGDRHWHLRDDIGLLRRLMRDCQERSQDRSQSESNSQCTEDRHNACQSNAESSSEGASFLNAAFQPDMR